jgi:hypothetical protein
MMRVRSALPYFFTFCAAIFLFSCHTTSDSVGIVESDYECDTTPDLIYLADANNYSYTSVLHIPETKTAAASNVDICWGDLINDFQCHEMDPKADVDNVTMVRIRNMSETEIEEALIHDTLQQSDIDGYLEFQPDGSSTCVSLANFTFRGSPVNIAEEYVESDTRKYLLVLTTGTVPGVGARMMTFMTPLDDSTNTSVEVGQGCEVLDFSADLTSLTPVKVPSARPVVFDWSNIAPPGITRVMIGFYEGMSPSDLQDEVLDLMLISTKKWELEIKSGTSAAFADATDEDGERFNGFNEVEREGSWVFALLCEQCRNPTPPFLTLLDPIADDTPCHYPDPSDTDSSDAGSSETDSVGSDESTDSDEVGITDIVARIADNIATVVIVEWKTNVPSTCRVEFGEGDNFIYATPMETVPLDTHRALLLGMPSGTDVQFRIVASNGDTEVVTDPQTVTTGDLPTYLPNLTVEGSGPDGFTLVPIIGTEGVAVTLIDSKGRIVWYYRDDRDLDIYRVRLSHDKQSLLYNAASVSGSPSENSELMRVSLDGSEVTGIPVPLLAHDFVELEDGTLGAITAEYRTVNDTEIMGNQIVEVSMDGTVTPVWSTWDCFDPAVDQGDTTGNGWTFANALDYDPKEDVYYIGFMNFSSIAKVDRKSGECLWVFGSTAETISFADGAPQFLHQHQFQVLENGILIFDNDGAFGAESRVVEYAFDFETNTASEVWSYMTDPSLFTFVLGEPIRLANGNTFINWSASGQMNLVTPDKESLYQLNLPMGDVFGFDTIETSLY